MARSAHAYVRGSTDRFYDWLSGPLGTQLPAGPAVWICGAGRRRARRCTLSRHLGVVVGHVPSWPWEAVVDLVAVHERAYLEHCRRYALEADQLDALTRRAAAAAD